MQPLPFVASADLGWGLGLLLTGIVLAFGLIGKSRRRVENPKKTARSSAAIVGGIALIAIGTVESIRSFLPEPSPPWVYFNQPSLGYSVEFPGTPTIHTSTPEVQGQQLQDNSARLSSERDQLEFRVSCTEFPSGIGPGAIDAMKDGMLQRMVECVAKGPITLGSTSGWELIGGIPQERVHVRCRMFVVGNRLYKVIATGSKDSVMSSRTTHFVESFALH